MAEAAYLPLPYPEAAVIEEDSLGEQTLVLATELPERPLVLGGCCCSHIGAVEALAARHDRLAIVWLDAHGDLNTPESSPSGNEWGMPLRMIVDSGAVQASDVALVGARNLDPPEEAFIAESGLRRGVEAVWAILEDVKCAYIAFDGDAVDPGELAVFMPESDGLTLDEVEALFRGMAERAAVLGAGLTGLVHDEKNVEPLTRLCAALRL
jgi:arginase